MKRLLSLLVIVVTLAPMAISAPASAPSPNAEGLISARTGKKARAQSGDAARAEARHTVEALLSRPLTSDSAAQIALLNNQTLLAAFEESGLSSADLLEAGRLKNPTLEGSIRFPDRPSDIAGALTVDLLDAFMLPLRKRIARERSEQSELHVADAALNLVADAKAAFFEVQAQQQTLGGAQQIQATAEASLDLARQQHEAGNISDLQLAEEEADESQTRLETASARAQLQEKREKLSRLLGVSGRSADWKISGELSEPPDRDFSAAHLEDLALARRFDLAAARAELAATARNLGLTEKYRYLGSLDLGASGGRDADNRIRTGPTLRLELPIFDQGQARVARGEAQLREAEHRLEALAESIRSDVREQCNRLLAARDAARLYRGELLPQRRHIVDLTLLQTNAMFAGAYDLLRARRSQIDAERGGVEASRDYWVARAALERAVGGNLDPRASADAFPTNTDTGTPARATRAHRSKH